MTIENLKSKLHAIFEECGMKKEETQTPIEIKGMVKEDAVPPQPVTTPAPVVPPAASVPPPAQPVDAQQPPQYKTVTDKESGIAYKVFPDNRVTDMSDQPINPDIQAKILKQENPETGTTQTQSQTTTPTDIVQAPEATATV
jgi:hypothetical protein